MRRVFWSLLFMLLLSSALVVSAQDDARPPVLAVLASIPDTPEARAYLTYADYAALTGGQATQNAWIESLSSALSSGPNLSYFEERAANQETLIGVALFATAQGAEWGEPPAQSTLYQGAFDTDAISAAYAARDYTATPLGDFTLFCGPKGCDAGSSVDVRNRNPGDPFGGELGAQRPVLLLPLADTTQLIGSPSAEVLELNADAAAGNAPSLADSPDYQAAVRAITEGDLLQAYFVSAEAFGPAPDGVTPLAPYSLAVIAETATDEGPLATITLAFPSAAEAEAAAPVVEARLESDILDTTGDSFAALLKDRGILLNVQASEDAETGLGLVQLTFQPPAGEESAYKLLVRAFSQRLLPWLAVSE